MLLIRVGVGIVNRKYGLVNFPKTVETNAEVVDQKNKTVLFESVYKIHRENICDSYGKKLKKKNHSCEKPQQTATFANFYKINTANFLQGFTFNIFKAQRWSTYLVERCNESTMKL